MRGKTVFFILLGMLVLVGVILLKLPKTENCEHDEKNFRCVRYVRNYDADTIVVNIPHMHPLLGKEIAIRVKGIDTAEIKGSCLSEKKTAQEAKALVRSYLEKATRIDIQDVERDKYFRVLGDVLIDGKSIADMLLEKKLAYRYFGGRKLSWCSG